ncbi:MAG: dethiobiotin synthase [Ghiorsea sp.]
MSRSIFITATDTGAGKTWVTTHLIKHLLAQGINTQALKPIASGTLPSGLNEDVEVLLNAQGETEPNQINFHTYQTPVAPALAGQLESYDLDEEELVSWVKDKEFESALTLIEGVGGLMAPLIASKACTWLVSDWLASMEEAEVMLVVPLRLGCMNHLLLTCEVLEGMGRAPKWIVLNDIEGQNTGEETKRILSPYLARIFDKMPAVLCVRQPSDLTSIL